MINFARDAGAPLYWLSTSFVRAVAPDAAIRLAETNVIVNYCRSKARCEELIADSGVPHTIFRPTNIIGDSRTGEMAATQAPQLVAELVCRGRLPIFPARPGAVIDVMPQDLVARGVAGAVTAGDLGEEYWITGGPRALSVGEAIDICITFMAKLGHTVRPPEIVDPEDLDQERIDSLGAASRSFVKTVFELGEGQAACGEFPSSMTTLSERYGLEEVDYAQSFERGLEFWARKRGLLAHR